jgi:hypothetical protein
MPFLVFYPIKKIKELLYLEKVHRKLRIFSRGGNKISRKINIFRQIRDYFCGAFRLKYVV